MVNMSQQFHPSTHTTYLPLQPPSQGFHPTIPLQPITQMNPLNMGYFSSSPNMNQVNHEGFLAPHLNLTQTTILLPTKQVIMQPFPLPPRQVDMQQNPMCRKCD